MWIGYVGQGGKIMATVMSSRPQFISEDEWQVRCDLAACYRLFVKYGWTDLIFTHLTARVPGHPDQYLINPYGLLFHEITASSLIKVDFDGNVLSGDYPYNNAGHSIHTAVLKVRPEVNAVLHSHTRAGTAVSCMECGLLPLSQQGNEILPLVCYHEYDVATSNKEECERLGNDIGINKWAMLMHNHGALTVGRTVAEAFYFMYYLEIACKIQVDVLSSGQKYVVPNDSALKKLADYGRIRPEGVNPAAVRSWEALIRDLDNSQADYKK
tara:strand:- start:10 stop:816 length:807 start_codon:yes stop_codon:yes gene_type:complete